jgi:hypothetical protein
VDRIDTMAPMSRVFAPALWREPGWVRPFLTAYRVPWVIRSRAGHPLRQGYQ